MRAGGLVLLALVLAGCTSETPEPAAPGPAASLAPAAAPEANLTEPNATEATGNANFPAQERDLHVGAYAYAGPAGTGNMHEASWQVQVPAGARAARALANFTGTLLAGPMHLMIHVGALGEGGEMVADASGPAPPLQTELVPLPEGTASIVVMCHPDGEPGGAMVNYDVHLRVEFA